MGQKASPTSNKFGINLFWNNLWDDKINFSKKLKEDIFINIFFFLVFNKSFLVTDFFLKHKTYFYRTLNFSKYTYLYTNFLKIMNEMEIITNLARYKIYYLGRLWVLRFQNWTCVVFSLYIPQILKEHTPSRKKKKTHSFKLRHLDWSIKKKIKHDLAYANYLHWKSNKVNLKTHSNQSDFTFVF
jgi:hypothetical protein